jgi:hypothetical protein
MFDRLLAIRSLVHLDFSTYSSAYSYHTLLRGKPLILTYRVEVIQTNNKRRKRYYTITCEAGGRLSRGCGETARRRGLIWVALLSTVTEIPAEIPMRLQEPRGTGCPTSETGFRFFGC